jgi:SAM-dependent methyltransferase
MAKANEIAYVEEVARLNNVPLADFERYLLNKPFSDPRCHEYLMDAAQIMSFLPPAPAKLLDVGVGSGWTSELFAKAGYEVTGIDISPDMIALAKLRDCSARFVVSDYEVGPIAGKFDAAVIYDALHHADDEQGHHKWGPRIIAVAGNLADLWGEQHRIETRTKPNHSWVNSGRLTIGGNYSRSPNIFESLVPVGVLITVEPGVDIPRLRIV